MRVLAVFAFSFSAAVFAAVYLLPFAWTPVLGVLLGLSGLLLLLSKRRWTRLFVLMLLGASFGLGWFYVHDLRTLVPARLAMGSTRSLEATVLEDPVSYERYCRVTLRTEGGDLPRMNALLYDKSMSIIGMQPGDRIRITAEISAADRRYGEETDDYLAKDVYLKLNTISEAELLKKGGRFSFLPVRIHRALVRHISSVFPQDCSVFMRSLLLGDKSDLYRREEEYLALSRAGNMHALAVSGLHVAFLVGLIQLLLGKRRFSSFLCIALVWCFVLVTGASPSAVRAGVMQSLLLMAPILHRENDPPTTLAFALGLILLHNPRAAASVSLQLSFAAMAGILCFGTTLHTRIAVLFPKGKLRPLFSGLAAAAASSLAVLPFTIPLMAVHFGYISLISPLTGVLCYLAISFCFIFGYLACLFSLLFAPLGTVIAWIAGLLARYILWISGVLAAVPHAVVYLEQGWSVLWLIGVYVLFLAARFLPLKPAEKLLIPFTLSLLVLLLCANVTRLRYERGDGTFGVVDVGQGQCLCLFDGAMTAVIDCGNMMSLSDAGDVAGRFLISRGRSEIDTLILTHPDADHISGVPMLMEMLPILRIVVPANAADESGLLEAVLNKAKDKGCEIVRLDTDSDLVMDQVSLRLTAPIVQEGKNDAGLFVQARFGNYDVLITGDASQRMERMFLQHALPEGIDLLVVGHHGSQDASSDELLRFIGADTAVISVGYNTYGHPAEETLERLAANGYNVFRTDRDGNIIFHIEDGHGKKEP